MPPLSCDPRRGVGGLVRMRRSSIMDECCILTRDDRASSRWQAAADRRSHFPCSRDVPKYSFRTRSVLCSSCSARTSSHWPAGSSRPHATPAPQPELLYERCEASVGGEGDVREALLDRRWRGYGMRGVLVMAPLRVPNWQQEGPMPPRRPCRCGLIYFSSPTTCQVRPRVPPFPRSCAFS